MHWSRMYIIWRRQVQQLLSNPLAYLFVLVYTLLTAGFLFFPIAFYTRNICDLQPLLDIMPWLMAVYLPAISMNSWAGERELHTDETLLTLPISATDIILGKWLGICSWWLLTLLCTLSNVIVLSLLGDPDIGLIIAQYLSWLLLGVALAGAALLASCLVSAPSLAFILGTLFCAICVGTLSATDWFMHFNRGRLHFSPFISITVLSAALLGCCLLLVSCKRWPAQRRSLIIKQIAVFGFALLLLFNLAIIGNRSTAAIDITDEQLSTLSSASQDIIDGLEREIHIHAFVQKTPPDSWQIKAQEVLDILDSVAAISPPNLHINVHRPADSLDEAARNARTHFGIEARRVAAHNTVAGQESDLILGLALQSGKRKQIIPFVERGMSVEFHLLRALHALNKPALPVLGIVHNDFPLLVHHDYQSDRMRAESPIVKEWRKRFNIVEVGLHKAVSEDIDVLVVAMPSSLEQQAMDRLQDYLWHGGKALLLEDPAPMWSQPELAPAFSREHIFKKRGLPVPQGLPPKGNALAFYQSLGIYFPTEQIVWSNYNPSYSLRQLWPRSIVWVQRNKHGLTDAPHCSGIQNVMLPFPGHLMTLAEKSTTVTPLLSTAQGHKWGLHDIDDYISFTEDTGFRHHKPETFTPSEQPYAIMAAAINGPLTRSDTGSQVNTGIVSEHTCQVVLIADCDFIHDRFYNLYTQDQPDFNDDDLTLIRRLQNIQFINNSLDVLCGDTSLLDIRTRQLRYRSLHFVASYQEQKAKRMQDIVDKTRDELDAARDQALLRQERTLAAIEQRSDLNETGREQLYRARLEAGKRELEDALLDVKQREAALIKDAETRYRRAIDELLAKVRLYALLIPGILLSLLAAAVGIYRYRLERASIPGQRLRPS